MWNEAPVARQPLGELVEILSGFPFKSEAFSADPNEGTPLIRIRDIKTHAPSCSFVGDYDPAYLIGDGDIIVGMDGEFTAVRWQGVPALLNQRVLKIRSSRPELLDNDYLFHRIHSDLAHLETVISGTTVKHLSVKDVRRLEWCLPPLDEQRRIAEVLRSVDEAVNLSQRTADQHLALWAALTDDLIWRPTLADAELLAPLGHSIEASDYGVNAPLYDQPVGIAVLRMGNIQHGQIDLTSLKWGEIGDAEISALKLQDGDILFNRTNSRDLVGKVALVHGEPDYLYASYLVRLRIDRSVADPYFIFAVMNSRRGQAGIRTIATPGVSQSNINPTNLKKLLFPRYSLERQREMARLLQGVEAAWLEARREVERLCAIRAAISSQLLFGCVRVPA
ncbi:MAG: restriction endonuclease subunit S [Pseudomonas balearica]|nr:restriction endonuclease subunit S [Stutzerimonas balearica]